MKRRVHLCFWKYQIRSSYMQVFWPG